LEYFVQEQVVGGKLIAEEEDKEPKRRGREVVLAPCWSTMTCIWRNQCQWVGDLIKEAAL
jgi:hypothetical protein